MVQKLKTWSYRVDTDLIMADFFIIKNDDYTYKVMVNGVGSKIISGTPDALSSISCSALSHHIGVREKIVDLDLLKESLHIDFPDENDVARIMYKLGRVAKTIPLEVLKLKIKELVIANPKLSGKADETAIDLIVMRSLKVNPKAEDFHANAWVPVMRELIKEVSSFDPDIYTAPVKRPCHSCQGGGCPSCQGYGFSLGNKISGELKIIDGSPHIVCDDREVEVYMPEPAKKQQLSV